MIIRPEKNWTGKNEKKKVFLANTYISGNDNGILSGCVFGSNLLPEYTADK
jgi:hypothetical protein